ncbi:serine/threonine-protein kinase VIK isoform X1 [Elaeis guineensis]|uniref:non-specific serine/threonine protein kinase n=1 Tax=Elaeis guineensis var. tenera TaxID=51953 RepID=A0A6I9QXV0_ELAGV|nr:integrin-linked protein kinase 1 [Elaeis guineensis]
MRGGGGEETSGGSSGTSSTEKQREKARVSRTSLILWHTHQNDVSAVRKLLEEDPGLVNARDYDNRTPLHVASIHGWIDVSNCLLEYGADVNAQDRWKNTPLADAEGAKKFNMIELLKSYGGLSFGQNGSHFEPKPVPPPLPKKCDWEIEPSELDFSTSTIIGKGSFGEILKAYWRGTPVAVKRILPSLSEDRLVIQDFRHEVNLLVKLRHPNIVQFLGAVTERKPLMLITEYLRGGDLHQFLKEKGSLSPLTAVNFALDIARGMAYLHNEPNVIIHRDLKPRNVLLVNSNADHLKVGDFGLSKLIRVRNSHDVYKMTGETGSYRYMAPEVFKHRKYDKKVDVFSFAMILYEMLEGDPPFSNYEPYEAAKYVAEGQRPTFRAKGYVQELRELTTQCWSADMNQRPSFLEILKRLEKIKEILPQEHHWHIFRCEMFVTLYDGNWHSG